MIPIPALIFCTCYADSLQVWESRYRRWIDAVKRTSLPARQILIVDDGSPCIPTWPDATFVDEGNAIPPDAALVIYRFKNRLGRAGVRNYPGWYRSFCFAGTYASHLGVEKVIHLESDAFLISNRIQQAFDDFRDGWASVHVERYNMPESAIQVIAGTAIEAFKAFCQVPYESRVEQTIENIIPFTQIFRQFLGGRYGETLDYIPIDAEWAVQVYPPLRDDDRYYWWLSQKHEENVQESFAAMETVMSAGTKNDENIVTIELDFERVKDRRWRFFHDTGPVATESLVFLSDGKIGGYQHRNETYWRIEDGLLSLLDVDNTVTVRFDEYSVDKGRITYKGRHLPNPDIVLCLREQAPDAANEAKKKRSVQSFDIFDTILARTVLDPTDVFDIVEQRGVANFKNLRLCAQALSNHTWKDIYTHYKSITGVDDSEIARIQRLELAAEVSVSYLITETYNRIRNGDILVSDMYLPRHLLATILKTIGFVKQVEIFVSPAGKSSGQIWPDLKRSFDIEHHLGDNPDSDVQSPAKHCIPSSLYLGAKATLFEALFVARGAAATSGIVRRFRLTNPFSPNTRESRLHDVQAVANLPFLLLMAVHLHDIMEREDLSRILFTTRDSCLLQPLYSLLFPDADSHVFYSSRIAFTEQRSVFVDYVKRMYIPGDTLIFDLHGAFKSGRDLFQDQFGALPRVHIFSGAQGRAPDYPGLSFDVMPGSNVIEALNLDCVGSFVTIDDGGQPIRTPMSTDSAEVGALYRTIAGRFVEALRPHIDSIRRELIVLRNDIPWVEIHSHIQEMASRTPDVPVTEFTEHRSLTQIMNDAQSDKGNTYKCAHCYTYVYERLINEFTTRERLSLLEIGLNRDGSDEIPSIRGWRTYLGNKVTLYGVDISPRFLRHHNPADGIHILVADQSKAADLARCGVANPHGYDIIIDDGSHMSSHQQTALSSLWQFLRPGGLYIIEDLHYQPEMESVLSTRELMRKWRDRVPAYTSYIGRADALRILCEVATIELHDSLSRLWGDKCCDALAVIRKQN